MALQSRRLRGRRLLPLPRAVQLMTDTPARLFGLRDRGRIEAGRFADVVLFDPATVDSGPAHRVYDLPAASMRLTAASVGVVRVFVNGEDIRNGEGPATPLKSADEVEILHSIQGG